MMVLDDTGSTLDLCAWGQTGNKIVLLHLTVCNLMELVPVQQQWDGDRKEAEYLAHLMDSGIAGC